MAAFFQPPNDPWVENAFFNFAQGFSSLSDGAEQPDYAIRLYETVPMD
jgi:hypothetical protein